MKNGLPKFVQPVKPGHDINYVYRTQYPRYLIEIHDQPAETASKVATTKAGQISNRDISPSIDIVFS
jgi:hypothetical protein